MSEVPILERRARCPLPGTRAVLAVAIAVMAPAIALLGGCADDESRPAGVRTVRVHESSDLEVAIDPAGGRLAFTLLGGLWTLPDTGGRARRITPPDYRVENPAWSPIGSRVAVVSVEGSTRSIRIVEAATGEARVLAHGPGRPARPAWSPDAARLVYTVVEGAGCDLWLADLAEGTVRRLTELPGCEDRAVWVDDGIVFAYSEPVEGTASAADLWAVSPDGGEARVLLRGPGDQRPVSGTEAGGLLYLSFASGETNLLSHPAADTLLHRLPDGAGGPAPVPGPEGAFVVPEAGRLWRVDSGGERSQLRFEAEVEIRIPEYEAQAPEIELDSARPARGIFAPRLAPDGGRVAFSAMGDIWVAPLDGSAPPRTIVSGPAEESMPAWAPDGRRLVYVSNRAGDQDLWIVSLEGDEPRRLTALAGDEREPAWDPTGRRIAFSFFDNRTVDLFWVPANGGEPRRVTRHEIWHWDLAPTWDPEGRRIAFLQRTPSDPVPTAAVADVVSGGAIVRLDLDGPITGLAWRPGGELIYRYAGRLHAVPVDPAGLPRGEAEPAADLRAFHPSLDATGDHLLYLSPEGLRLRTRSEDRERLVPLDLPVEPAPVPPPLTIRGVRLVDGTGRERHGPVDIRIRDGRIESVVATEAEPADPAPGVDPDRVVDGTGLTALPGLIDMHTHLFHYGPRAYLGTGVTTVRDVGFESHLVASRWEGVLSGRLRGPRIVYAGEFLDGRDSRWMGNFMTPVAEPNEVRREVARLAELGAGWIKTYTRMSPELRRAAIEAAHAHGLPTTQHEIFPAVAWGADGKEHVRSGLRQDLRAILAGSGAVVVTTIETGSGSFVYMRDNPEIWDDGAVTGLIPAYTRASFREAVEGADSATVRFMRERHRERLEAAAALYRDGVRLAVGTDPTNPYVLFGVGVHWELEHLVEAGLDPLEAIHLATGAAAEALGLEDALGTVEPGKLADLILVEGDPAANVRDTRRVRWIVFGGELLRPEELYLERVRESIAATPAGASRVASGSGGRDR